MDRTDEVEEGAGLEERYRRASCSGFQKGERLSSEGRACVGVETGSLANVELVCPGPNEAKGEEDDIAKGGIASICDPDAILPPCAVKVVQSRSIPPVVCLPLPEA